jgi:hypothetical protein
MIVKHKEGERIIYINFDKVTQFKTHFSTGIRFMFDTGDDIENFNFESEEKRNEALEKILDSYRCQRQICNLE